jgi:hypothetical protein
MDDVLALVRRIAAVEVDDGLVFDPAAASTSSIRDEDQYAGVRVSLPCVLAPARIRFHVDVNVGGQIGTTREAACSRYRHPPNPAGVTHSNHSRNQDRSPETAQVRGIASEFHESDVGAFLG